MKNNNIEMRLAITNLGKYNEGHLVYEYLDLPFSEGELDDVLETIGINKEYEEYFISDYETNLDIQVGEYTNINQLNEDIEELMHCREDINIINAIISQTGKDLQEVVSILINGDFSVIHATSYTDLGMAIYQDFGYSEGISSYVENYIDFEAMGRDSDYTLCDGDIAISIL